VLDPPAAELEPGAPAVGEEGIDQPAGVDHQPARVGGVVRAQVIGRRERAIEIEVHAADGRGRAGGRAHPAQRQLDVDRADPHHQRELAAEGPAAP
jgi:hypothetical protein